MFQVKDLNKSRKTLTGLGLNLLRIVVWEVTVHTNLGQQSQNTKAYYLHSGTRFWLDRARATSLVAPFVIEG